MPITLYHSDRLYVGWCRIDYTDIRSGNGQITNYVMTFDGDVLHMYDKGKYNMMTSIAEIDDEDPSCRITVGI